MRLNRWIPVLFVLALVAAPAAADCNGSGKPHDHSATEAKATKRSGLSAQASASA